MGYPKACLLHCRYRRGKEKRYVVFNTVFRVNQRGEATMVLAFSMRM